MDDSRRAALLMILCMAAFSSNDAIMKALGGSLPLGQALFLRGLGTTALIAIWAGYQGVLSVRLRGRDRRLVAWRAVAEAAAAFCFVSAVFNMPLANATAILQALPLTVTLAAAWFLGESLGPRRIFAIGLGLIGVLLILRPGAAGFDYNALYAVAAVLCVTLRDLLVRAFPPHIPSLTAAIWGAVAVTIFGALLGLSESWVWLDLREWVLIAGSSMTIMAAYVLSVAAMRVGHVGGSAPFRYSALLFALILGVVFFGEWPDLVPMIGAGLVVFSGLYAFYAERSRG